MLADRAPLRPRALLVPRAPSRSWSSGRPGSRSARRPARSPRSRSACRRPDAASARAGPRRIAARVAEQLAQRLRQRRTGFHSANVFRTPGSVAVGTNVLAMNVIGKISDERDALDRLRASAAGCRAARRSRSTANENANISRSRRRRPARSSGSASRRPGPQSDISDDRQQRADQARDGVAAEHRAARDRQRAEAVDRAVACGRGRAPSPRRSAEHDRLGEDPAHQELPVAAAAGHADRAAEHVGEQQHEHDRLDRRVGSASGWRRMCSRPRRAIDPRVASASRRGRSAMSGAARGRRSSRRLRGLRLGDRAAPVSVRNTSSSVGWRRPRSSTSMPASASASASAAIAPGAAVGRRGDRPRVRGRRPARRRRCAPTTPATASRSAGRRPIDVQLVAADLALELRASPRAITRPWSTTTMSSARRSASSRYCVVSRIVVPPSTRSSSTSQSSLRARGSRPVVGSSRNSTSRLGDQRRRQVEPAAHAAGVRLAPAGRPASASANCSSSSPARARAARRAEVVQLADHHEVLAAGEQLVDRRVLRGQADAAAHLDRRRAATSSPATRRRARVGLGQRGEDAHGGGLAGAVRARAARRRCRAGTSRSTPARARLRAVALDEAHGFDGVCGCGHPPTLPHRQQDCTMTVKVARM